MMKANGECLFVKSKFRLPSAPTLRSQAGLAAAAAATSSGELSFIIVRRMRRESRGSFPRES
ncbi:hypothetical protein E2C01_023813 [Portunus trituberculatus]|uniref:Uncharacterized protein n=1 Tax=Portunus trituberculatus TaxID=210409 RepID=A0A5B7EBJ7_PORTR|nr:hypothetical protein [Portunus trituberculatus]